MLIFILVVIVIVMATLRSKKEADSIGELDADGEKVAHGVFNDENQRVMDLRCEKANWETEDRMAMQMIQALIFKKGRMTKDIKVTGDKGFTENNYHNFFVQHNARMQSEDFDISSDSFLMKDRDHVVTDQKVEYKTKQVSGIARKGMDMYVGNNVLKFYKTRGHYKRENRDFSFKTDVLWVIDKDRLVVLEKNTIIKEADSLLRSNWVSLKFSEKYKHIAEAAAQRGSYLFIEDKENKEIKEIKALNIVSTYDEEGKLSRINIMQNAEIIIRSETDNMMITSDNVELYFDAETGKIKKILIPTPGHVENTGETEFRLSARNIKALYNENAELYYCEGDGDCEYIIEDYSGVADLLAYDIENRSIIVTGEKSTIKTKQNTFRSSRFEVDTEKRVLKSNKETKSSINLEKQNVLFAKAPVFINANKFEIHEKDNKLIFDKQTNLLQGNTSLKAKRLEIVDDNKILAQGNASLVFKNEDKEVTIKGNEIIFNPSAKQIQVKEEAAILNDDNLLRADEFSLEFDAKNEMNRILGTGNISFSKETLNGSAGKFEWLFKEDTLILKDEPQIEKEKGGTTFGDVLKIDLKTSKVTILSGKTDRTETVIE